MFLFGAILFDYLVMESIREKHSEHKEVYYNNGFTLHAIIMYFIIVTGSYISTVCSKKKKLKLLKEKS